MPPAALYLHVPFCVRRCLYCDFYVLPLGSGPPARRLRQLRGLKHRGFLQALDRELDALPKDFQPRTVYVGGGTPTELPPEGLQTLFESLRRRVDFSQVTEFTCEANPGTLDAEIADVLIAAGVNRLSLGAQSFSNPMLESLGRIHDRDDIFRAVSLLRERGVRNLSLDLLFGLPGEQQEDLDRNLEALRELQPEHVSWYSLEFEPGTAFTELRARGALHEPAEEQTAALYAGIRAGLRALAYDQYELFSFSRPGFACVHNLNYWRGGEYYGCGPAAHAHIDGARSANRPDLRAYLRHWLRGAGDCRDAAERLPPEARARERLMTALRLCEGVDVVDFNRASGFSVEQLLGRSLQVWLDAEWLERQDGFLRLRPEAYLLSDSLFREFI